MSKRLYVSGPMSGWTDYNFPAFNEASAKLRDAEYAIENPADKGVLSGWEWEDYLRYDLAQLLQCDGVAVLPSWHLSKGACFEVDVATKLRMPVHPVETWIDIAKARGVPA